ncbi:uncharacterized protein [Rutidosis leptorrhynchoides]|uniref:uncharacterized protein n=1 Tax=Rutidosis leptorrhynchoides TaxID=125765 RepID=UPI003A99DD8D
MATADDGMTLYQNGGAGGKFRKKPIRRSAQTTPYARPPTAIRNNNPSLLSKLVDPASRLLYAGADRLFGVFRKRLPAITAPRIPENIEEPRKRIKEAVTNSALKISSRASEPVANEGEILASASAATETEIAATEISELENVLKQKTFTRSEIERLTALLHSRTTESDAGEGDKAKLPSMSHFLRHEPSSSGLLSDHVARESFRPPISTPLVNSRAFDEDVASPAELAKAYMGTRPAKVSPSTLRLGCQAPRQDSVLLNNTTIIPRTPIASPVTRTTDVFKGFENVMTTPRLRGRAAIHSMARTPYYRGPSTSSQKAVASPLLISSQSGWEQGGSSKAVKRMSSVLDDLGSGGPIRRIRQKANLPGSSQKLLLRNGAETKASKEKENAETSSNLGYASVPTESTKMASKIFEQLERMSPKEKPPVSRLALGSLDKVDSPKFLLSSLDEQKTPDTRELTTKSSDKVAENGSKKYAVPRNVLSSTNGDSTMAVRSNSLVGTNTESTFKVPAEPPQKKRAFQMSAHEDTLELDAHKHSNGYLSTDAPAEVKTPEPSKVNNISELHKFKNVDAPKSDFGPPEGSDTQPAQLSKSILTNDVTAPQKEPTVFPSVGTSIKSVEKASQFSFSAKEELSGVKPNTSLDIKSSESTSYSNLALKNERVQFSAFNSNNDNGSTQKSVNMFSNSETSSSASPFTTSASSIFSFGGSPKTNGPPASISSTFASLSSIPAPGTNTSNLFSTSATMLPTTTTSAASSASLTSAPTQVFSFEAAKTSTQPNCNISNSFTTGTGSSLFSFSSPPATSTTNNISGLFQASTQASTAITQAAPFKFGSSTTFSISGTTSVQSSSSGSSLFSSTSNTTTNAFGSGFSSTPSFGFSSAVASSDTIPVSSTSGSTTSIFGSTSWQSPQTSAFGSPSPFSFGASSTTSVPSAVNSHSVFGSSNTSASTGSSSMFSFTAAAATTNTASSSPVFGAASPINNDQMSVEDSMAEDSSKTPSSPFPAFTPASGGTPGFMFGSGNPTPSTPPFQFGGQTNQSQPPSQNPFQASGSVAFNGGGGFSLGSGGVDKSARRILRVKGKNRKK